MMGRWPKTSKSKIIVILYNEKKQQKRTNKVSTYIVRARPVFFLACFDYLLSSVDNVAQKVRHSNHSTGL